MCKYKYKKWDKINENNSCIYPNFFIEYESILNSKLPIDSDGFCIYHSSNAIWKAKHDFSKCLNLLIGKYPEINSDKKLIWEYNFIGFVFTEDVSFHSNVKNSVSLSYSIFNKKVDFSKFEVRSIELMYCEFKDKVTFSEVIFSSNLYGSSSIFENGLKIKSCIFKDNAYFEKCLFNNISNSLMCEIGIEDCQIQSLSIENSEVKPRVAIRNCSIDRQLVFDRSNIYSEFLCEKNIINGTVSFKEADFLLSNNLSDFYSSFSIINNILNETGKLIFKGKKPMEDMVKGELALYFKEKPKGLISFDNFNLNKICLDDKNKLLIHKKENPNLVEISANCRKYYRRTDFFVIDAKEANQKLILNLINVFCNYFEVSKNTNLGVEIVERNLTSIRYYYFTDEQITLEEFLNKIRENETNIFTTLKNLTTSAQEALSQENYELVDCLIKLEGWWKMIAFRIKNNNVQKKDLLNITNSISIDKKSENEIITYFKSLTKNNIIMAANVNFNEKVNNVTFNDYTKQIMNISNERDLQKKEREKLMEIIEAVKNLPEEQKINQLEILLKKWLPTVGRTFGEFFKGLGVSPT